MASKIIATKPFKIGLRTINNEIHTNIEPSLVSERFTCYRFITTLSEEFYAYATVRSHTHTHRPESLEPDLKFEGRTEGFQWKFFNGNLHKILHANQFVAFLSSFCANNIFYYRFFQKFDKNVYV